MSSRRTFRVAIAGLATVATIFSLAAFSAPAAAESPNNSSNSNAGKNAEVTVYLTRHGETWLNTQHRMQGWSDSPLTAAGELDAQNLGKGLAEAGIRFKSAYSADMVRHYDTISLALGELGYKGEPVRDKRLREVSFGKFEGATQAEVFTVVGPLLGGDQSVGALLGAIVTANGTSPLPAESLDQLSTRTMASLNDIASAQAKKGGGNVLVVSSGITIMAALETLGADLSSVTTGIDNAAVSKLTYKNGTWTVVSVNDSSYVEAGAN